MPSKKGLIVVIGTGGTIAGSAAQADSHVAYTAGALDVQSLVDALPALAGVPLQTLSVAQIDSADMDHATLQRLVAAVVQQLASEAVAGVVITHGTDTLEETAYLLHRVVAAAKPVVLTAAMRPATALSPDGPQNLFDAVAVAREPGARGVLAVLNGRIHASDRLRKVHGYAVDAFSSGEAGVLGLVEDGQVRRCAPWPEPALHVAAARFAAVTAWPVVDIVTSHAGARGASVDALVAAGAQGLVIAGTGNGSVHREQEAAARRAVAAGVRVWRASRCQGGGVVGSPPDSLHSAGTLTAPQARIELLLDLLGDGH
jgi:L-asparaginase